MRHPAVVVFFALKSFYRLFVILLRAVAVLVAAYSAHPIASRAQSASRACCNERPVARRSESFSAKFHPSRPSQPKECLLCVVSSFQAPNNSFGITFTQSVCSAYY